MDNFNDFELDLKKSVGTNEAMERVSVDCSSGGSGGLTTYSWLCSFACISNFTTPCTTAGC